MKNKRLQKIAEFIEPEDSVVDIGCDHAYLAIYLKKEKKCPIVMASDINTSALNSAKKNIQKENLSKEIPCILSDGLEEIPTTKIDTAVIAGMGTHTILNILKHEKTSHLKNIIIQSNNDLELLRESMQEKGYKIVKEAYIEEKGHDYFILKYQKGEQYLTELELKYGFYRKENEQYYQKVMDEKRRIQKRMPWYHIKRKKMLRKEIKELNNYFFKQKRLVDSK